jgi:kynurenine formamidase
MARNERAQWARLDLDGVTLLADLAAGASLVRPLEFHGPQLRCFGAAAAHSVPLVLEGFNGRVAQGASCNASVVTLAPHANTTHTEAVGHLTIERVDAWRVIPQRLLPAVLLTVQPQRAAGSTEGSLPPPDPEDLLITAAAIERAWPAPLSARLSARAAVIRTLPNERHRFSDDPQQPVPSPLPFLSSEAASALVERGVEHLVLDVPSADRASDGGALTAHRIFFGLPPQSTQLAMSARAECTLTELAFVGDAIADGWYLLSLQAPAIAGDAVPSRPVLYPLRVA